MPPVVGLCGWSGSGKTSLIEKLLPLLIARGLRVSTVKHTHHDPDLRIVEAASLLEAGAAVIVAASPSLAASLVEEEGEPDLAQVLAQLAPCDLVLVEGFKRASYPRIEVWRVATGKPLLCLEDGQIAALATDVAAGNIIFNGQRIDPAIPILDLNAPEMIAGLILRLANL